MFLGRLCQFSLLVLYYPVFILFYFFTRFSLTYTFLVIVSHLSFTHLLLVSWMCICVSFFLSYFQQSCVFIALLYKLFTNSHGTGQRVRINIHTLVTREGKLCSVSGVFRSVSVPSLLLSCVFTLLLLHTLFAHLHFIEYRVKLNLHTSVTREVELCIASWVFMSVFVPSPVILYFCRFTSLHNSLPYSLLVIVSNLTFTHVYSFLGSIWVLVFLPSLLLSRIFIVLLLYDIHQLTLYWLACQA